jgi:hypothetical protein
MSPFGASQATSPMMAQYFTPQQAQMSPQARSEAFGPAPPQQMGENPMGAVGMGAAVEADSERGNSPSPRPGGASGIEAFLARQGRMSPSQTNSQSLGTGSESGDGP